MIRYFIRHYWRYLAMALAFATISFLLGSCKVNAETGIQTTILNYTGNTYNRNVRIFSNNNNIFSNWGRSYITFNVMISTTDPNATLYPIEQVSVSSTNNIFVCNIGNTNLNLVESNTTILVYDVACDTNIGVNGIQAIDVTLFDTDGVYPIHITTSQYMTIYQNLDLNIAQVLAQQQAITQGYLNTIHSAIDLNGQYIVNTIQTLQTQLITNNNTNTQAIIDKINEIIENNQVCNYIDKVNGKENNKSLNSNGGLSEATDFTVTDYIRISKKAKIKLLQKNNTYQANICFYNINKEYISCIRQQTLIEDEILTIPNNASYIRITIEKATNRPQWEICDTSQNITNHQNQEIINQQNETNNTLKDSSIDEPNSDLEDMQENEISNSVISDLLLLPINMFENIVDAIGGTCSSFPLGELLGTSLVLPCINIPSLIGNNLWNIIDVLFCGIFVLSIRKKFVDIFENITSLKDRGNELE